MAMAGYHDVSQRRLPARGAACVESQLLLEMKMSGGGGETKSFAEKASHAERRSAECEDASPRFRARQTGAP